MIAIFLYSLIDSSTRGLIASPDAKPLRPLNLVKWPNGTGIPKEHAPLNEQKFDRLYHFISFRLFRFSILICVYFSALPLFASYHFYRSAPLPVSPITIFHFSALTGLPVLAHLLFYHPPSRQPDNQSSNLSTNRPMGLGINHCAIYGITQRINPRIQQVIAQQAIARSTNLPNRQSIRLLTINYT